MLKKLFYLFSLINIANSAIYFTEKDTNHQQINSNSKYINVGDWIKNSNYLVVKNEQFQLKSF